MQSQFTALGEKHWTICQLILSGESEEDRGREKNEESESTIGRQLSSSEMMIQMVLPICSEIRSEKVSFTVVDQPLIVESNGKLSNIYSIMFMCTRILSDHHQIIPKRNSKTTRSETRNWTHNNWQQKKYKVKHVWIQHKCHLTTPWQHRHVHRKKNKKSGIH